MEVNENHKNLNNILSRNDSAGFSYFRCNEGIPFEWEMQPGISKHPQPQQQHIPPLTPPPAILSSNLPTPSSMSHHHPHFSSKLSSSNFWSTKLLFWKRNTTNDEAIIHKKQSRWSKKLARKGSQEFDGIDVFTGVNHCFSARESMAMSLPFDSSFSMFSSSSSSGSESPVRGMYGKPLRSCFPMYMRKIQVSFARQG